MDSKNMDGWKKALKKLSDAELEEIRAGIEDELQARSDDKESKRPMSEMSHDQFEKFAAHLMAAKGDDA